MLWPTCGTSKCPSIPNSSSTFPLRGVWRSVGVSSGHVSSADKLDLKRRRTERIRRERIDSSLTSDMENRRRSRSNSQSDPIRRGRGRPKTVGLKKQEEDKGETRPDPLQNATSPTVVVACAGLDWGTGRPTLVSVPRETGEGGGHLRRPLRREGLRVLRGLG